MLIHESRKHVALDVVLVICNDFDTLPPSQLFPFSVSSDLTSQFSPSPFPVSVFAKINTYNRKKSLYVYIF